MKKYILTIFTKLSFFKQFIFIQVFNNYWKYLFFFLSKSPFSTSFTKLNLHLPVHCSLLRKKYPEDDVTIKYSPRFFHIAGIMFLLSLYNFTPSREKVKWSLKKVNFNRKATFHRSASNSVVCRLCTTMYRPIGANGRQPIGPTDHHTVCIAAN